MSNKRLEGKTAIVTGGGCGMGSAICQVFAREGASVAIVHVKKEEAEEIFDSLPTNASQKHCIIVADISKAEDVEKVFTTAEENFGTKCNVLVNCAGVGIPKSTCFGGLSDEEIDKIMNFNFKGTCMMAKQFVLRLKDVANGNEVCGTMVNLSNITAKIPFPYHAEYAASKAAVTMLTKTIATEFPEHKIRANVVVPGYVDTPTISKLPEEQLEAFAKTIPLRRIGKTEEIANVCLFLASDESSYVNGACLDVTGGV